MCFPVMIRAQGNYIAHIVWTTFRKRNYMVCFQINLAIVFEEPVNPTELTLPFGPQQYPCTDCRIAHVDLSIRISLHHYRRVGNLFKLIGIPIRFSAPRDQGLAREKVVRPERVNDLATPCFMNLLCRVMLFGSHSFAEVGG